MEASVQEHIQAFIAAFVTEPRRDRWLYLFDHNPKKFNHGGSLLFEDLDRDLLVSDKHLEQIANRETVGVLYEIGKGVSSTAKLSEVLGRQPHFDAIYSIVPGKLAVFIFHEGERYVLRAA